MITQGQFPDEQSVEGAFIRQPDVFQGWVTANGSSGYQAASGRYHLYVSWACPWAHRTIIVRKLKKLEGVIGMTAVDPIRDERGWAFREGQAIRSIPSTVFSFSAKPTRPPIRTIGDGLPSLCCGIR
jgi:glutathionyl-hydroquinone reductase